MDVVLNPTYWYLLGSLCFVVGSVIALLAG
jgi:hypothetical protein